MSCTFSNLSEQQVRAKAEHDFFYGDIKNDTSQKEIIDSFIKLRENIKTVDVPKESINPRVASKLAMKDGENYQRYVSENREFVLSSRITDANYRSFLDKKGIDEAQAINKSPDSIITAGWGTKIHNTAQSIMENIIHSSKSKNLLKNDEPGYGYTRRTKQQAMKEWGLSDSQYEALYKGVDQIVKDVIKKQIEINPTGKVKILTEQFLGDFMNDLGGTADVLALFSNGAVGILDYKTKSPATEGDYVKAEWDAKKKQFKLIDKNWLPPYAIDDFNRQIGTTRDILKRVLKRDSIIFSRIVPIHVQFEKKEKADRETRSVYKDKLVHLTIGTTQDKFLQQIPIKETESNLDLDRQIRLLESVIHNYEIDYKEARKDYRKRNKLQGIIQRKREALNSLIIERDVSVLYKDFENIIKTYINNTGELVDIDNPERVVNGKKERNPFYLNWRDLNGKIDELRAYKAILETSIQFAAELKMEGKDLSKYKTEIDNLTVKVGGLLSSLYQKRMERTIDESDKTELADMKGISTVDKMFLRDKEFTQKAMKMLNEMLSVADNKRRTDMQNIENEIKNHILNIQKWAKDNGASKWKAWEMLLGDTNLIAKHNAELYKTIEKYLNTKNVEGLKKIFKLKDNAEEIRDNLRADFLLTNPTSKEKKRWEQIHNFDNMLTNPKLHRIYYEFTPETENNPEYLNEKFIEISKPENKALLDFWEYWTKSMEKARDLLDLQSHEDLPYNFLPWIRGMVNEMIGSGDVDLSNAKESIKSVLTLTQDDEVTFGTIQEEEVTMKNKIDIMTGVEKLQVPRFYMTPLKNAKGQVDVGLKTRDLPHALYMFMNMAHNYHYLTTEVEPHVEALRDSVALWGQQYKTPKGNIVKDATGRTARFVGGATDLAEVFERTVKYHVYGKKILDDNAKTAKALLNLKSFHTAYQLGGSWLAWAGNTAQVFYNLFSESYAGYFFTGADLRAASAVAMGAKGKQALELYKQLVFFWEPNPDVTNLKARRLKTSAAQKIFDQDSLYWGFRVAEHGTDNLTMYAMLKNFGVVDGNIVKLDSAPKGTKSLLDSSRIENGELIIDGIKDKDGINVKAFTSMRNRIMGVNGNMKGTTSSENQYGAQMTLAGQMLMHYKTWLPGMLTQRFSNLRYNDYTKSLHIGTYRSFMQDLGDMDRGMLSMIGNVLIPNLLKLSLAVVTFPAELLFKSGYKYKTSEFRARRLFEKFKEDNKTNPDIQNITFEEFLNYQRSRIKALSAEIFFMLSLYLAYSALRRDWDEDGVPDWRSSWLSRTLFRITNRARREVSFIISWDDWQNTLLKSPLPSAGVLMDAKKVLENTLRESGDIIWMRDDDEQKGAGIGTYSTRMIPYYKAIRSLDILDKEFEKYEF